MENHDYAEELAQVRQCAHSIGEILSAPLDELPNGFLFFHDIVGGSISGRVGHYAEVLIMLRCEEMRRANLFFLGEAKG